MQRDSIKNGRVLLIAGGFLILALGVIGPKSIWGALGVLPVLAGLTAPWLIELLGGSSRRLMLAPVPVRQSPRRRPTRGA